MLFELTEQRVIDIVKCEKISTLIEIHAILDDMRKEFNNKLDKLQKEIDAKGSGSNIINIEKRT